MSSRMTAVQQCRCGKRVRDLVFVLDEETEQQVGLCFTCAPKTPPSRYADRPHTKLEARRGWWHWLRQLEPHVTAREKKARHAVKTARSKRHGPGPAGRGCVHVTKTGSKVSGVKFNKRHYL
jgi:hypothetical protein